MQIGVLVNNVGISYEHPDFFDQIERSRVDQLVTLNCDSTAKMTHIVLPHMLKKDGKKKGAVVNIASGAGKFSNPLLGMYCAAKAFVIQMTRALGAEYEGKGIDFQVQYPLMVVSKLSKLKRPNWKGPSAANYAKKACACIGYDREISPWWSHYMIVGFMSALPWSLMEYLLFTEMNGLRKRALKKKEDAKKGN